jgi:hypothetical protein
VLISPAEVAQDRAMAESEMIDRCRITRAADTRGAFNEATGQYDTPAPVVVYEGRCRVQVRADINSNAVEAAVGDHEWTYRTATLELPVAAGNDATGRPDVGDPSQVVPDCVTELLESPLDPSRVGRRLVVTAETKNKTLASCRKFATRELLS